MNSRMLVAVLGDDTNMIRALVAAGANVEATDGRGRTALMEAAIRGGVRPMRYVI